MPSEAASPAAVGKALVERAVALRRGEELVVASWTHTLAWATACVAEARRLGARATLLLEDESTFWRSVEIAPATRAWSGISPSVRAALQEADALIYFPGPADQPRLRALPPARGSPFHGSDDAWLALCRKADVRGVRCLLGYASDAQAERWNIPGALWRSQMIRAIVDSDPRATRAAGAKAARILAKGRELRLTAPNGTDVRLRLRHRAPWIDDGRIGREHRLHRPSVTTVPGGTVVVAVDETSAQGTAIADRPSFLAQGRADGGQWDLERGRLTEYWYTSGSEAFEIEFSTAPKGREILGLFAVGLNPALPSGVPQAEDASAGTVTLAIGGNAAYDGSNSCRYLSWLTIGEATVAVDGAPLVDRGELLS
ncbi:MAG: aminopeptidase [Thermoplasmata archaeon]|jgi:leucyl aminopeptidase (aminopeptidase T)|nr:aminopeptidase [Thermoplasmata archaeon]